MIEESFAECRIEGPLACMPSTSQLLTHLCVCSILCTLPQNIGAMLKSGLAPGASTTRPYNTLSGLSNIDPSRPYTYAHALDRCWYAKVRR